MAHWRSYGLVTSLVAALIIVNTHAAGRGLRSVTSLDIGVSGLRGAEIGASDRKGNGDSHMRDFEGRTFEFVGEVGGFYNIISEEEHQVSMKLKLGERWDHNGTYMEGLGFRYQDHKIVIELAADGNMHVFLDGKELCMSEGERTQEHVLGEEPSELTLTWQERCPTVGQAVKITTDLLSIFVYVSPAGMRDEGGVAQPAHLSYDAILLRPPVHEMKGIVGGSYARLTARTVATFSNDFRFPGVEAEFKMDGYFSTAHKHNAFGVGTIAAAGPSRLVEHDRAAFPMQIRANGVPSKLAEASPDFSQYPAEPRRRRLAEAGNLRRHSVL